MKNFKLSRAAVIKLIILLFPLINMTGSPKVRTGCQDHERTGHFGHEKGFFQEFLIKDDFLRAGFVGFDWSGWIFLIKSEILISTGMAQPC